MTPNFTLRRVALDAPPVRERIVGVDEGVVVPLEAPYVALFERLRCLFFVLPGLDQTQRHRDHRCPDQNSQKQFFEHHVLLFESVPPVNGYGA